MIETLSDLVRSAVVTNSDATALEYKETALTYDSLANEMDRFASFLLQLGMKKHDRVAIFAEKRPEFVISVFGTTAAGGTFVPINTLFKEEQIAYILRDCSVRFLVTNSARLPTLQLMLDQFHELDHIIVMDELQISFANSRAEIHSWPDIDQKRRLELAPRMIGSDMAAIMYTSGSTGKPKGVVLSHTNLTVGATSVADYIGNTSDDRLLAVLPFSFDAGFSQVTTAFAVGACVVLHNYFLPRDVVRLVKKKKITGITGVPPLWMQLAEQDWSENAGEGVRYFANTGGKMPGQTLGKLRSIFANAAPFLMYGLTEAFRSTYLPPSEVDRRPDSIGKAIPNVDVQVVADDGKICGPGEPGELVHRGPLVALGYWNDSERTAARFKAAPGRPKELTTPEVAVWSGDTVRSDSEGYLYFVGRKDDMIKSSGYRISPTEIEEIAFSSGMVSEVAALGLPHDILGQGIFLVAKAKPDMKVQSEDLLAAIRDKAPNYMVPLHVEWRKELPRNANGKLDRKKMASDYEGFFATTSGQNS